MTNTKYVLYQASDIHIRCSKSYGSNKTDVLHFTRQLMSHIEENGHLSSSTVILLLGDIFDKSTNHLTHTGTIVSTFKKMLYLMKPCTVLIIPGNHDIPRDNTADDIITACLQHSKYDHVIYCKTHGLIHTLDNTIRFYHHPVVLPDVQDSAIELDTEQYFNIGLFHEQILEKSEGKSQDTARSIVQMHKYYDLYLVGDAHNRWSLPEYSLVYSGAPIQHRMGECIDKYFVQWTIQWDNTSEDWTHSHEYVQLTLKSLFIHIPNITTDSIDDILDMIDEQIDKYADETYTVKAIKLEFNIEVDDVQVRNAVIEEYRVKPVINIVDSDQSKSLELDMVQDTEVEDVWQLVTDCIRDNESMLQYHSEVLDRLEAQTISRSKGKRWQLRTMKWSNVGCYGSNNSVDFSTMKGMIHLRGKNSTGKSTFIDILLMALYGTAGGSMSTDTILNNIYSRGNYSIELQLYTPDDNTVYTIERYGTRKTMKHKLSIEYANGSTKILEGARNIDMHLSTVLPTVDGTSSYSLLTSTCIALQERSLNITDIRFNVVDDLDRVIDDLSKELNSNNGRVQLPDIPTVSKYNMDFNSIEQCTVLIQKYESELVQLQGLLSESSLYNSTTLHNYSTYGIVNTEEIRTKLSDLSKSLYPDSEVEYSNNTINSTLEQLVLEMDSLNLGSSLTNKSEAELQSIIEEYDTNISTITEEDKIHDIPIALRSKPYSSVEVSVLPSVTVLDYSPIATKYYSNIRVDDIPTELDRVNTVLSKNRSILLEYEEYCTNHSINIPTTKSNSIVHKPVLKHDLVRVEYRSKPKSLTDIVENIDTLYNEVMQYEEYCSKYNISIPTASGKVQKPVLKDNLVRIEYRSRPKNSREKYNIDTLNGLKSDREQCSKLLQEYEEYCTKYEIVVQTNSTVEKPDLNHDLVRVEYRSKPRTKVDDIEDNIESKIQELESVLSKSCRVNPTLLCTDCKNRVECMTDEEYEDTVQRLEKYRHILHYKQWSEYDKYSKYVTKVGQYTQYLRSRLKSIDTEIESVQQYLQWIEYYKYEQYITTVGQYTAYIRSKYNASVQYRDWKLYEEYDTYIKSVGQYTSQIRSKVKEYEDRLNELTSRQSNHYYEQCHDYYWHLNRRHLINSEIAKYRHDLRIIRDKRRKKHLEYSIRVLKGQHNSTVREQILELETKYNGKLCYDKCVHNTELMSKIQTIEQYLLSLDEWIIYYRKIQEYDEWNRQYEMKRQYLTILEEVRDNRLEYCRSTVERVCNEMLHNIYGNSKRVVISRDVESKRCSNKYRILLEDNGRIVRRMAHSIKFILDVLIRCALIRFNSNLPNFMIIDEGFGALDVENAVQFWSELKQEMNRYLDYTIVIDHGVVHDDDLINSMTIRTDVTESILQYS